MAVQPIYIDVEEEVPELIERLRLSSSREIPVVVPARSRLAQSRFNFQLLRDYARRLDKQIAIISADPAVKQMATENGFSTFSAVAEYSERDLIGSAVAVSLGAGMAGAAASGWASPRPAVVAPPVPARDPGPPRLQVRPQTTSSERRGGGGRFVAIAITVLALLLALIGAAVYIPSAKVTLIAQAKDFSQTTDIQAAPGSAPVRVRLVSQNKQASRSFQSTGTKVIPAATAQGGVVYKNDCPLGASFLIRNGQRLATGSGITFAQLGDVRVESGSATPSNVIAVNTGPTANVPAGTISVIAGNGYACLSVNNPAATAGGTDEQKLTFVSQGDLDAAKAQLDGELRGQVQDDLTKLAQPGEKLADSIDWKVDFFADHKAADGVATFTGTATETGSGAIYNGEDVKKALVAYLQKTVPKDQALTDNQVATDFHVVSGSADGHMAFHGSAKGFIAPKIDFAKVRARLAGQNTLAARSYLSTLPVQSPVDLSQQPFQLPIMPVLASRIDIKYEVQAGAAATHP